MALSQYGLPHQSQAPPVLSSHCLSSSGPTTPIRSSMVAMNSLWDYPESSSYYTATSRSASDSPLTEPQSPLPNSPSTSSSRSGRDATTSPRSHHCSPPRRLPKNEHEDNPIELSDVTPAEDTKGVDMTPSCFFVRRLYRLLEDPSLSRILCWGPGGDFFVIRDVDLFTTTILPRHFKHSNFASFVRQLNKYDFHKIKAPDGKQLGKHSWLFRHDDFRAGGVKTLGNIKRKVRAPRKPTGSTPSRPPATVSAFESLLTQAEQMVQRQAELMTYAQYVRPECTSIMGMLARLQQTSDEHDETMRRLVQYALRRKGTGTTT